MNGTPALPDPLEPTPGFQTSEGRLTLAMSIVGTFILVITLVHPGFKIDPETKRDVATVLSLVLPALVAAYQQARAKVKVAAFHAKSHLAQVQTLQAGWGPANVVGTATTTSPADREHHRA